MQRVPDKIDFAEEEEKISKFWHKTETFRNSLKQSVTKKKFTFFDGPPFATGLPHYGHVLTGTVKDIVTRFAHQSDHYVGRRFGWDCHGLPVEYEIDKLLNITGPQDVNKMGISSYNAECRSIVMRYSHEWEVIMGRLARWVDFEDDYKTMYPWYMESIWFIFRELYMKGLVYRGVKVMPYSTACNTPLSNFESGQNYKDVVDPQVTVGFPLVDEPSVQLVAWTTTPWTLPSNLTLCVHPDLTYVKVKSLVNNEIYILMEARLFMLFSTADKYEIQERFPGSKLAGKKYLPLFPYFANLKSTAFKILVDKYVSDDAGTGVVHQAPYFGEDDYRICLAAGIITKDQDIICPVDDTGCFTEPVKDFLGQHVKIADKAIIQYLKKNEGRRLIDASTIKHSYPFCWRSETPLIYRAVPSWFVRVEPFQNALLKSNQDTYWVPEFVKEKRFGNWLKNARDWAISRNRYWGTPIPLWISEDGKEIVCVGSIAELEHLTGQKVTDLHRESIDHLTIPSVRAGMPPLRRVSEVFDCWFESGSMPYAQLHFPFTRDIEINFHKSFPADFIAEGIDQTRGWFYTLLVISTVLFNKAPFKNLIASGLVLAADGQKMSKRKKNYPDPVEIVRKYGADALRLYLINSPVVRAENLRFKEDGVRDVLKDVLLPWYNAYRYLAQSIERLVTEEKVDLKFSGESSSHAINTMDRWIKSTSQTLVTTVWQEMKEFYLYKVVPVLVDYIDQLTNWYIRMNRKRLKGDNGTEDCIQALSTLFEVLWTFVRVMAPFTPYICELMFQNLRHLLNDCALEKSVSSVHFLSLPQPVTGDINLVIERRVRSMQFIISAGRVIRDKRTIPMKYPLPELTVIHKDLEYLEDLKAVEGYILEELNIKKLTLSNDCDKYGVTLGAQVDHKALGARLKNDFKSVLQAVQSFSDSQVQNLLKNGVIEVLGHTLSTEDVFISYRFSENSYDKNRYEAQGSQEVALMFDMERDASMHDEGLAREVVNLVQKLRKKAQLVPTDPITVYYQIELSDSELAKVVSCHSTYIEASLRAPLRPITSKPKSVTSVIKEACSLKGTKAVINLEIIKGDQGVSEKNKNPVQPAKSPSLPAGVKENKEIANNKKKNIPPENYKKAKINSAKHSDKPSPTNKCSMVPCVGHVIVKPTNRDLKQDVYDGLIVAFENPIGKNRLTYQQLKKQVASHFGISFNNVKLYANGKILPDTALPIGNDMNGVCLELCVNSSSSNEGAFNKKIPNQPFINLEYQGKQGIVFLTGAEGREISAEEIIKAASEIFDVKGKITLSRESNAAANSLVVTAI